MTEQTWITKKSDSDKEEPKKESKWIKKKSDKKEKKEEPKKESTWIKKKKKPEEKKKWIGHKYDAKRPQGGWKD